MLVFCILVIGLAIRFFLFYQTVPQYHSGKKISFSSTVQQDPKIAHGGQQLLMQLPSGQSVIIQSTSNPVYEYGDQLHIAGILEEKTSLSGQKLLVMYYPTITVLPNQLFLWPLARMIRSKSQDLYTAALPGISASLLTGIVLGIKEHYPQEFLQDLKSAGVLHVIAASGMNISFIAGTILFSLRSFLNRKLSLFFAIFAVIFYTFIVGFQPSIVRAGSMAVIAFTAKILGRQNFALFQ